MAQFQLTLEIGGTTITETLNFSNARGVVFLDYLIALQYTDEVDDGSGGTRPCCCRNGIMSATFAAAPGMIGVRGW